MKLLGILLITFGFTQCGSLKLEKNPPFEIVSAKSQNWIGGMPGSNGMMVTISYKSESDIAFDSIYFSKKISKLQRYKNNGNKSLLATVYTSVSLGKSDLIMHSDTKKELKNELPKTKKFPFELKENEAIISYLENGIVKFYKIENIRKGKPIIHQ